MRGAQQYAPKADPRREAAVEDLMSQVTGVFFGPARRYDSQPFAELWRSPAFLCKALDPPGCWQVVFPSAPPEFRSLTCLLTQPNIRPKYSLPKHDWSDHFALPNYREARWRRHGRGVQGRGHQAPPLRCLEVPS